MSFNEWANANVRATTSAEQTSFEGKDMSSYDKCRIIMDAIRSTFRHSENEFTWWTIPDVQGLEKVFSLDLNQDEVINILKKHAKKRVRFESNKQGEVVLQLDPARSATGRRDRREARLKAEQMRKAEKNVLGPDWTSYYKWIDAKPNRSDPLPGVMDEVLECIDDKMMEGGGERVKVILPNRFAYHYDLYEVVSSYPGKYVIHPITDLRFRLSFRELMMDTHDPLTGDKLSPRTEDSAKFWVRAPCFEEWEEEAEEQQAEEPVLPGNEEG